MFGKDATLEDYELFTKAYASQMLQREQMEAMQVVALMKSAGITKLVLDASKTLDAGEVLSSRYDDDGKRVFEIVSRK